VAQENSIALDQRLTAAERAPAVPGPAVPDPAEHGPAVPDPAEHGPAVPDPAEHGPADPRAAGGNAADRSAADCGEADRAEALQAGEQQLRRALGRAPFGMVMISLIGHRQGSYLAVNDTYGQLTGYSWRELAGACFLGDVHPEDQPALEVLIQEVTSGQADRIRAGTRLVRKDGEIVCVQLTGSAIQPPDGGRYLAALIEDRTATEQARAEVGRLEHELLRSHRLESLGQLVGGVAHDFGNLLAVIGNFASLVHDEVSVAEATESATRWEPVRQDIEKIEAAADRARRLVRQLQAFARREETQPVPVDLDQLISDVIRLLGQVLGEHIRLVTWPGTGLWPVQVDPGQLEQAIISIAVNARDAMPAGGQLTIDATNVDTANTTAGRPGAADRPDGVDLAGLPPGRYVELRIGDTGAGMDAVTAERAFEPFFTTKSGDQAAGLGLSAVYRFAARAGGKAWLRSEPGNGTAVTLLLPAAPGSGDGAAGPAAVRPAAEMRGPGTVLVVDDEPAIRDVVYRILTQAGHRVMTAAGQTQAIGILGNPAVPVDLLLTDVVMPGMTGEAFAAQVEAVRPGTRVLFMSGYEQPPAVAGAQVLAKPFSRAALLAQVSHLLIADPGAGGPSRS
jgi:PAS domain S-box-containing protein